MTELFDALGAMTEYEYANPWAFSFLLMLPILLVLELWIGRSRHGALSFSRTKELKEVGRGWRVYLVPLPGLLRVAALGLIIIAMARPQTSDTEESWVEGIDIYLVLDMSGSMQAVDMTEGEWHTLRQLRETPQNRFENAQSVLRDFVEDRRERCNSPAEGEFPRCDRIGMVVFGRDAFLEFPLTLDYGTILNLLAQRQLNDIDGSGTAIGNAVARAVAGLRHSESESKVVVLITDGDRRGGDIAPAQSASMADHFGINVFPILVGREGPTLLPPPLTGDLTWDPQVVEFPVNPELLQKIATMTGGEFYRATDRESLERDLNTILDQYERTEVEGTVDVSTTEKYPPFAYGALYFLLFGAALNYLVIRKFP